MDSLPASGSLLEAFFVFVFASLQACAYACVCIHVCIVRVPERVQALFFCVCVNVFECLTVCVCACIVYAHARRDALAFLLLVF